MPLRPVAQALFATLLLPVVGIGQSPSASSPDSHLLDYERVGSRVESPPADPAITAALAQISPARIQATIEKLVSFGTRNTLSSNEKDLPPGQGIFPAADWIHSEFTRLSTECNNCLEVHDDTFTYTPPPTETPQQSRFNGPTPLRNVYAILHGSDPSQASRIVLITGHYDTRRTDVMDARNAAPGANDDSSGTAVSLECARILAGTHFPATIIFVAVAGEEQGLTGSHHLAELAKQQNWNLEAVLNNDIVGGDTTPGDTLQSKSVVRVFSQGLLPSMATPELRTALITGADNDTSSRQLAREVLAVARIYTEARSTPANDTLQPRMELRLDRYLRGGDHSSFSALGFPAVRFTEWRENFNHQHQDVRTDHGIEFGDLLKFDDFNYIARVARLNAATLSSLASAPGLPLSVRVVTHELDNNTTLRWTAPISSSADLHYEVVWRETTANDWQYAVDAAHFPAPNAEGLAATLPISKDNVFFGVRACNVRGQCSPAVAPTPER